MTPEAQRIAIAKACGRVQRPDGFWFPKGANYGSQGIPDYLNDLNAMHEATQSLTKDQLRWYRNLLIEMTGTFEAIDATAAERAEAFLRTIGKWEYEAKP